MTSVLPRSRPITDWNNRPRTILITGCSSGIGRAVAIGLQQRGWRVFASARRPESVTELAQLGLESLPLDLTDSQSIHQAVATVLERTGGQLYALFNNGAYAQPGAVEDLPRAALQAQFETNLFGTHELTCQLLPTMRAQQYGRIIQNSSILGFMALKYRGAYVASKFALEGLTDTLRLELRGSGVDVVLIEPGPITSNIRDNSCRAFRRFIDPLHSPHRGDYETMATRLCDPQAPPHPFTLPPEAVLQRVIQALESHRPRIRYPITMPTHLFAVLKRLLPHRACDWLLRRV
ncbi:MAG: SDR family NAD(P)-dependent oxidoreductase [Magnetococcales bacterium]|nr:SDR family NAD(P)-dependent oxidoreductase [Magnetococcales bacterium]